MKNRKIVIAVATGVVFLLCLAGLWFAYGAYAKSSKVKDTLGGSFKQLQTIYSENPFPSKPNVDVLRSEGAWLTNWFQSLVAEMRMAAVPTEDMSSSGFIQKLQDISVELQRKAAAEGGKVLPDNFAFGFDQYLGRSMPKPENVKRLSLQFAMVEAITREILDSHVSSISQIEREKFEVDSAETPAATGRRRPTAPAATAGPAAAVADSGYPRQHFSFAFTGDERAISEVLSRLAKMPMFVVVTEIKIDRQGRGLLPRPEKPATEADKMKKPASDRVVSGTEIAPLLKTQLQVDVYTFEGV